MEETPRKLTPPTEREYYLKELGSMLGENPTETPLDVLSAQTEDLSPLLERDMLPPVKEDGVDLDLDAQEMSALGKRKEGDVVESGVPNGSSAEPSRRRKVHMFEYAVKSPGNKESVSKEPQFKSVEDAVLAIADGKFKDEVVSTIIDLREKNEIVHDTSITPSSVGSIIAHLIRDKVLVVDKGGVFRVVRVGGGSTHESDDVKKSVDTVKTVKPSIIDKMNTFVDTVTDKALEGTAYGRLVDNIESLMRSAPPKIKAKLSEVYQSAISGQNVERILNNLAAIEGLVPDSEYAQLVQDAREGVGNPTTYPDWLIPEPPPVVEPPIPRQKPKEIPTPVETKPSKVVAHPNVITIKDVKERGVPIPPPVYTGEKKVEQSLDDRVREAAVKARRIDISQKAARRFLGHQYRDPVGPITQEQSDTIERDLTARIDQALKNFATQEALRKQKIYAHKKVYEKIMTGLGVSGKQRPDAEGDIDQAYIDAKKEYIEASRALRNFIARRHIVAEEENSRAHELSIVEKQTVKYIDIDVMKQFERERNTLNSLVQQALPEKEKNVLKKGLEMWARLPVTARVGISTALLSVASGGVGGFAATTSIRAVRGLSGVLGAKLIGSIIDKKQRQKTEIQRETALKQFATINTEADEDKLTTFEAYESEAELQAKRDRLKKIAAMAVVGGATTVGTGLGINSVHETLTTSPAEVPSTQTSSWWDKLIKDDQLTQKAPLEKSAVFVPEQLPKVSQFIHPVEVDLSSKGFIDTIDQLKKATTDQHLTPALEKLFAQPSQKIAMDLGLFKPGQVAESALGFKGEQLAVDAEGNLSLVRDGSGETEILMTADGVIRSYAGPMFDAGMPEVSLESQNTTDSLPTDKPSVAAEEVKQSSDISTTRELKIEPLAPTESTAADSVVVGSAITEAPAPKTINFEQITAPGTTYTGPEDMVSGKLPLKPEYQFDPKFKAERTAYNVRLEKELMNIPQDMFDLRYPIEYNGGRINVFQKGENILILLNGQKIGTGQIINGQPGLQYEASLGKGMLGVKSDFEQAFEKAKAEIEKNKMFFKVKK